VFPDLDRLGNRFPAHVADGRDDAALRPVDVFEHLAARDFGLGNIESLFVVVASQGDLYSRAALEWNSKSLFQDVSAR
jgi:hypothetical protein